MPIYWGRDNMKLTKGIRLKKSHKIIIVISVIILISVLAYFSEKTEEYRNEVTKPISNEERARLELDLLIRSTKLMKKGLQDESERNGGADPRLAQLVIKTAEHLNPSQPIPWKMLDTLMLVDASEKTQAAYKAYQRCVKMLREHIRKTGGLGGDFFPDW